MNRNLIFSVDNYYHIYNRGTERRILFLDSQDYLRFTVLLYICNSTTTIYLSDYWKLGPDLLFSLKRGNRLVAIGSYCLMPNHFHLLTKELSEGGISLFMKKVLTSYSMYFNKKYNRTGTLFENRFKAKHLDSDNYLKYQFAYIHLNPVKLIDSQWQEQGITDLQNAKNFLKNYSYSSYLDYSGTVRSEGVILDKSLFPDYFQNTREFTDFINDWLTFKEEQGRSLA